MNTFFPELWFPHVSLHCRKPSNTCELYTLQVGKDMEIRQDCQTYLSFWEKYTFIDMNCQCAEYPELPLKHGAVYHLTRAHLHMGFKGFLCWAAVTQSTTVHPYSARYFSGIFWHTLDTITYASVLCWTRVDLSIFLNVSLKRLQLLKADCFAGLKSGKWEMNALNFQHWGKKSVYVASRGFPRHTTIIIASVV